jgi:hypothetical protein
MKAMQEDAHITHAVIGTQETINFGISTDPAFFQILSSTLYKNPILAVVRETLCNAWDAHIAAGVTDKNVEFSIKDGYLTIRDFGPGIPHDQIGQTYGIYGASTKRTDKRQTGSFGLGCKSPFAYVDHFEVTSWNQGVKSVYAISRSSATTNGTPGITRLLNVPTDQTGLQVRLRVRPEHEETFINHATNIIGLGGINALVDSDPIETITLDDAAGSWTLAATNMFSAENRKHNVYVRYGTVVYPVEHNSAYADTLNTISYILNQFTSHHKLIIQAIPESLEVMPNRESLSLQEETCKNLHSLLKGFLDNWTTKFNGYVLQIGEALIDKAVDAKDIHSLLKLDHIPYADGRRITMSNFNISNDALIEKIASIYVHQNLSENWMLGIRFKLLKYRFKRIPDTSCLDRGLFQSYTKMYFGKKRKHFPRETNRNWFNRYILGPVVSKLYANKLSVKSLYVSQRYSNNSPRRYRYTTQTTTGLRPAIKSLPYIVGDYTNSLLKIVFLAPSKKTAEANFAAYLAEEGFNTRHDVLVYLLPAQKQNWPTVHQTFKSLGYTVIDLTVQHDWMPEPFEIAAPKPKVTRIPGRRTLGSYYTPDNTLSKSFAETDPAARITQFQYYAVLRKSREQYGKDQIKDMPNVPYNLIKPIADMGVGVETLNSETMLRKQQIPSLAEFVVRSVTTHIQTSLTIAAWKEYSLTEYNKVYGTLNSLLVQFIERYPPIQQHLGLSYGLTDDDKFALQWWEYFRSQYFPQMDRIDYLDGVKRTLLQDTQKYLEGISFNPILKKIAADLHSNELLDLMDFNKISKILLPKAGVAVDPKSIAKTQAILMAAF